MRTAVIFAAVAAVLSIVSTSAAQTCEITGRVPSVIRSNICLIATSVHGGDEPNNTLTIMVTQAVAYAIRAQVPDSDAMLLTLLNTWMTQRDVIVARIEVYYGRVHLATARPTIFSGPTVEYH